MQDYTATIFLVNKPILNLITDTKWLFNSLLIDHGICLRCIFRVYGVESISFYRDHSFYLQLVCKLGGQECLKKYFVGEYAMAQICWLCEGILQRKYVDEITSKIISKIKQRGTKGMTKYKLNVKVPNVLTIKHHTFVHHLYQHYKNDHPEELLTKVLLQPLSQNKVVEIKTVIKWLISHELNSKHELLLESTINEDEHTMIISIDQNYTNPQYEASIMGMYEGDLHYANNQQPHKKVKLNHKLDIKCTQFNIGIISKMTHQQIIQLLADNNHIITTLKGDSKPNFESQVAVSSQNIYLCGKYVKYSRYLSQTPWIIAGKRLTDSSLQQEIQNKIVRYFYPQKSRECFETKFHSGGREDIDVRMLHGGRPFVLELVSPIVRLEDIPIQDITVSLPAEIIQKLKVQTQTLSKASRAAKYLQALINHDQKYVQVRQFNQCTVDYISIQLKAAESDKIKHYLCYIKTKQPLNQHDKQTIDSLKNLKVMQKTPLRVLHRRTLMVREKYVYRMIMHQVSECSGVVELWASAGTYIKQFIHGDLNRTKPNLGELLGGKEVDILQLDVGGLKEGVWDEKDLETMKLPQLEWEREDT